MVLLGPIAKHIHGLRSPNHPYPDACEPR